MTETNTDHDEEQRPSMDDLIRARAARPNAADDWRRRLFGNANADATTDADERDTDGAA